jgi:hypothetical protein
MKDFFCSNTFKSLCIFVALGFMFGACKHKTDFDALADVSYSGNIAPIISSNCAFSGCHGDSLPGSINLTTYTSLMNGGIESGSPQKSELYQKLKTLGDDIMPKKPYSELTEKQIQLIYVWIGQGAKNN